jgi:RNA polymerase sigma factor (sigma-70 family)
MRESPQSDLQLLARYTCNQEEDAFGEIVRRHIDLVYSTALRQVRSPQFAEEIAQSVFLELVRQADRLAPETILAAWLYQVTRHKALNLERRESRRLMRERIAVEANSDNPSPNEWRQIEPLLDEGMQALNGNDRLAILLRYFENRSLREVGEALGISDDAAQKRVHRALARLRSFLVRRGVATRAGGLANAIAAIAVARGPAGLAATIGTPIGVVTVGANAASASATFSTSIMTALQKIAITCISIALLATAMDETRLDVGQPLQKQVADSSSPLVNEMKATGLNTQELGTLKVAASRNPAEEELQFLNSRVEKLKRFSADHPKLQIPEFEFLTATEWLNVARNRTKLESESDFGLALADLRMSAQSSFASLVPRALRDYAGANHGEFPADVSQLKAYFKQPIKDAILQRYTIQRTEQADGMPRGAITDVALVDDYYDEPIIIHSDGWRRGPRHQESEGGIVVIKRIFDALTKRISGTHLGTIAD